MSRTLGLELNKIAGLDMVHVPCKGSPPALQDPKLRDSLGTLGLGPTSGATPEELTASLRAASDNLGRGRIELRDGDALLPKAGHIGNQEAKVCADALVRLFAGGSPDPAPVTNSACFSTITMSQASWLTAVFQYDPAARAMAAAPASSGASTGWNAENFEDMNTWFGALTSDIFA